MHIDKPAVLLRPGRAPRRGMQKEGLRAIRFPPHNRSLKTKAGSIPPGKEPAFSRKVQDRTSASVTGATLISTRRLDALPSSVVFDAMGCVSPKPRVAMRADWTPWDVR